MQRVENLVAQVGSLNDELRDTNKMVELAHAEEDTLAIKISGLKGDKDNLESSIIALKAKIPAIHELIKTEEERHQQVRMQNLKEESEYQSFENKIKESASVLKNLNNDIKKAKILSEELEPLRNDYKIAKKELADTKGNLLDAKKELASTKETEQKVRLATIGSLEELDREKQKFYEKMVKFESKQKQDRDSLKQEIEGFEKVKRDVRIVKARLKKEWEAVSSKPFPKI